MYFYNSILSIFLICLNVLFCVACSNNDSDLVNTQAAPYRVLCTVGMITDIVRNVAGEHAQVEGIIGEGIDPHLYRPTRGDVVKINQADLVFCNGLLLEGKMTKVLENLASNGKRVTAVSDAVLKDTDYLPQLVDSSEHVDPHVWMDVSAWQRAVTVVAKTLADFDPDHTQSYLINAAAYTEKLKALDAYAKKAVSTIPKTQRVLVTAHDAFRYMGRAYGIEVRGVQGVSTESESGVYDLEELVDFIVFRKIPAIFYETSVADKNVRALLEGARARGHNVFIGESLYSDAMGQPGSYEGTYIGMIDHNVTAIVNALGGFAQGFRKN